MIRVADVVDTVTGILDDEAGNNWSRGEILTAVAEGVRALQRLQPQEFVVTEDLPLTTGARQTLPAHRTAIHDVHYHVDGAALGPAVTPFDPGTLGRFRPGWMSEDPGPTRQWAPDARDPHVFWVYPPAAGGELTAAVSIDTDDIAMTTELPINSTWTGALVDYALSRAYAKDAEYAGENNRAGMHRMSFHAAAGGTSGEPA